MKHILALLAALLVAPLTTPMNFQGLKTVRLQSSNV